MGTGPAESIWCSWPWLLAGQPAVLRVHGGAVLTLRAACLSMWHRTELSSRSLNLSSLDPCAERSSLFFLRSQSPRPPRWVSSTGPRCLCRQVSRRVPWAHRTSSAPPFVGAAGCDAECRLGAGLATRCPSGAGGVASHRTLTGTFSFQVRVAFRQARLDHQPLWDGSQIRHRLLRRRRSQPRLPVHHPGRPTRFGLVYGSVGQDEGRLVALDLISTVSFEMGKYNLFFFFFRTS